MEVEIYLDSLFILNLMINVWILELLQYKFELGIKFIKIFLSACFGAGIYVATYFLPGNSLLLPIFAGGVSLPAMIGIILPKRKQRFFFKMLGTGLFYSFVIAGVLRAVFIKWRLFAGKEITAAGVVIGVYVCVKVGKWCLKQGKTSAARHIYQVTIVSSGESRKLLALLDTGNSLIEPISKKPVCLIEEELLAHMTLENPLFLRAIPYRSVGCEQGLLYGVEIPKLEILTEEKAYVLENVICAGVGHKLSAKGAYQMILHPALFTEENRRSERKEL